MISICLNVKKIMLKPETYNSAAYDGVDIIEASGSKAALVRRTIFLQ